MAGHGSDAPLAAAARTYEDLIAPFTRPFAAAVVARTVRALEPGPPLPRVLDHGAGTGLATRLLRTSLPSASVTALDPSSALLDAIRDPEVTVVHGAADALADASASNSASAHRRPFDAVMSSLAIAFCETPATDLAYLHAACRPGAALALTTLGPAHEVEGFAAYWLAVRDVVATAWEPPRYPHHRHGDPVELLDAARAAGWRDVGVRRVHGTRRIGEAAAWAWLHSVLPVGLDECDGACPADRTCPPAEAPQPHHYGALPTTVDLAAVRDAFRRRWDGRRRVGASGWLLTAIA